MTVEIPKDIGRNDPCPCGSGKKYKKCHMRRQQLEREAAKKKVSVTDLVGPSTIPFEVLLMLRQAQTDNLLAFFWEIAHDEGPLKARYENQAAFLSAADRNEEKLPAHPSFELARYRVDEPDVHILLTSGADDPRATGVSLEVVTLRRNEFGADGNPRSVEHAGWRLWDTVRHTKAKDEVGEGGDVALSELGVEWAEREFVRGSVYSAIRAELGEEAGSEEE